jgi:hypothetical protein
MKSCGLGPDVFLNKDSESIAFIVISLAEKNQEY